MRCQQRKQSKLWLLSDGNRNQARRVWSAGMIPVAMGIRQHPQVRSESAGPARGPGDLQREVHVRMEDPEGGVPRHAAAGPRHVASRGARCAAASAAARWVVPRVHRGEVERRVRCMRARGDAARSTVPAAFSQRKGWGAQNVLVYVRPDGVQLYTSLCCDGTLRSGGRAGTGKGRE